MELRIRICDKCKRLGKARLARSWYLDSLGDRIDVCNHHARDARAGGAKLVRYANAGRLPTEFDGEVLN